MNALRKLAALIVVSLGSVATVAHAQATGPDYTPLTSAISIDTTIAALLSVGGILMAISLVVMGIRKVMRMVRGA